MKTYKIRICQDCKRKFKAKHKDRKYCDKCLNKTDYNSEFEKKLDKKLSTLNNYLKGK